MKKIVLIIALALFEAIAVFAQNRTPEGFLYKIVDGKTVSITKYEGSAVTLNIPSHINGLPVTAIVRPSVEPNVPPTFEGCNNLTTINIPSSVTFLEESVFFLVGTFVPLLIAIDMPIYKAIINSSLKNINVDNRNPVYASIDGVLFDKNIRTLTRYPHNRNQETYIIPSSVTSIGNEAFSYCINLINIIIPSSVTSIGRAAFDNCDSLSNVTLSRRTNVEEGAFPPNARITYRD